MRRSGRVVLRVILCLLILSVVSWSKDKPKAEVSYKVCVAGVSNRTSTSLMEERMAGRLTKSLIDNKLAAVAMDSTTTNDRELHPTVTNGTEVKQRECDYVVLTQVRDPKNNWGVPNSGSINIGGRTPSTDASDSEDDQSRASLEIHYAVFRAGKFESEFDGVALERPSSVMSDSLMPAMDRLANRVAHDLKKKK